MRALDLGFPPAAPQRRGFSIVAVLAAALSLLLHGGLLFLMSFDPPWSSPGDEDAPVMVDLVPAPASTPPPPAEVKPEAPKPQAEPEEKPVPPPPASPARPAALEPAAPKIGTAKPPPALPPKPNLHPDKAAALSEREAVERTRQNLDPATRTISDLILTQVSGYWSPPQELRGRRATIHFVIDLLPNGKFGPPFSADAPWNPEAALDGLDKIPKDDPRYFALVSFYRTLRDIQPLHLPPDMQSDKMRSVPVWFLLDDMP